MDTVFREEKTNLLQAEKKIESEINWHKTLSNQYVHELNTYDSDDLLATPREQLRYSYKKEDAIVEELTAVLDEPYFGRMDLETNISGDCKTYYIGKVGVLIKKEPLIVDWRSEVGSYFYMKSERSFKIDDCKYELLLRRALNVKKSKLISYSTEFDSQGGLEGDVMDPFLITVLKDKRRERRLTDIIKTIQGNQNEIIRKPREEQFIVQGCAGSGKTMILLHRLSYLKFNNRNLNWKNVKIITPNKAFDTFINDLSLQLGLDEIERMSVAEYYAYLIKNYASDIGFTSEVESETKLDVNLLTKIYSDALADEIKRRYDNYWDTVISYVKNSPLDMYIDTYEDYHIKTPYYSQHVKATYSEMVSALKSIFACNNDIENKVKKCNDAIERAASELQEEKGKYANLSNEFSRIRSAALTKIDTELQENRRVKNIADEKITAIRKEYASIVDEFERCEQEKEGANNRYQKISQQHIMLNKYDDFLDDYRAGKELATMIYQKHRSECEKITRMCDEYANIPQYRLLARRVQKKEIIAQEEAFLTAANNDSQKIIEEALKESGIKESLYMQAKEKYSNVAAMEKSFHDQIQNCRDIIDALMLLRGIIEKNEEGTTIKYSMPDKQYSLVSSIAAEYDNYVVNMQTTARNIAVYQRNGDEHVNTLHDLEAKKISDSNVKKLQEVQKEVEKLREETLFDEVVISYLKEMYAVNGETYTDKNYRHKLYLKLLFCSFYYTNKRVYDSFLSIDEAQDISVAEYRLLRNILGNDCRFNLYGDVNQLIYSYKGISDWRKLKDVIPYKQYNLNENYRNTLQITEYCNKRFSFNTYPIGVTGGPVKEFSCRDAISWIIKIKGDNPDYRCAIIYKKGYEKLYERIDKSNSKIAFSWNKVDDSRISVITVEQSKGLEFEAIVSVTDGMNENERYISFTRALDELAVMNEAVV